MYLPLKNIHNIIGMVLLAVLLLVIIILTIRYFLKKSFGSSSQKTALAGLVITHLQTAAGLILYALSPVGLSNFSSESMKHAVSRFYTMEHPLGMIIAAILVTIGYKAAKNTTLSDRAKYGRVLIYYTLGFAIITYMIPWFLWS